MNAHGNLGSGHACRFHALKLAESKQLDLDAPIRALVHDVDLPESIMLTHLLRHTSGLRDYGGTREYHDAVRAHPSEPWTRQQFLDSVIPKGLRFAPGASWSYSNVGYMLVVEAIERATGHSFATVVDHIVVAPLGLKHTFTLEQQADMQLCVPGFGSDVTADKSIRDVRAVYHPGWCAPRLVASTTAETTHLGRIDWRRAAPIGGGPGYSTSVTIYPGLRQGGVAIAVFLDSSEGPEARECEAEWLEKMPEWR